MTPPCHTRALLLCRPEFTGALAEEILNKGAALNARVERHGEGWVLAETTGSVLPECVFERQRLTQPDFLPAGLLKPLADETALRLLGDAAHEHPLWTFHLLTPEADDDPATPTLKRLEGITSTAVRLARKRSPDLEKRFRPPHRLKPGGRVIQIFPVAEGLWFSHETLGEMINPRPGGFSRMKWDPLAPSRSFLKMEEALDRMGLEPQAGEKVIDLGAAPGGWTYSFLKRGCDVIAVDHGPMKLPAPHDGWGSVRHLRENGITYQPPTDWPVVDWLVADMLIAPGVALGLARRWQAGGRARRLIINVKLPQEHPVAALLPLEALLRQANGYRSALKQLYHDRREVTIMARMVSTD
ncbi:MAG TPA: SAM-dependent methyltransferase [Kiritimatiellia bacterium]|nr:SAM-dependent methyltransferase [Kiritimatiellia bacterium]